MSLRKVTNSNIFLNNSLLVVHFQILYINKGTVAMEFERFRCISILR